MRDTRSSRKVGGGRRLLTGVILAGLLLCMPVLAPVAIVRANPAEGGTMQTFEMADLINKRRQSGDVWIEFLRVPALSMGLYVLPADAKDTQVPHAEDEVYYVVSGRGVLQVEGKDQPVKQGSVLFVAGKAKHHFHSITEELTLMVLFAPAEDPDAAPAVD
ncbi:MAG: cupin domain-containing protein [Acidobacteria bacterium]|nr:cupin domain-containing protein [Acidobacteriota bacterium]